MPWGPFSFDDSGRSTNQPARPESGVLGVGALRHSARSAATSLSRLTQPGMSLPHSSTLQAPPGARSGAAEADDGATTAQAMLAATATSTVSISAHPRRT